MHDEIEQWMHEIDEEDERTKKHKVWTVVPEKNTPNNTKPLTPT